MTLLRDAIPAASPAASPAQGSAVGPPEAPRVEVVVPQASVRSFEVLDSTMAAAVELSEAGAMLTAATRPEMRALRRWLCGQVRAQSLGHLPEPWRPRPGG
jgi:hypothetical protein